MAGRPITPLAERFWSKVDRNGPVMGGMKTPCWVWTGHRDAAGYGRIHINGSGRLAHRTAWELVNGPIPPASGVLHHCDNPACVRAEADPEESHTFLGSQTDNMRDCSRKGRIKNQRHPELARGAANGRAKINENEVRAVRAAHAAGESRASIAARFGVTPQNVTHIVTNATWSHVA
jgi:hypothetical protein